MPFELVCPEGDSRDGSYRLEWSGAAGEHRLTEDGALLYEGKDVATTVTGRREGTYSYELSAVATGEVARCEVTVAPHSLEEAFGLLGLGALVFVCTLILVVKGHRSHRAGRIG